MQGSLTDAIRMPLHAHGGVRSAACLTHGCACARPCTHRAWVAASLTPIKDMEVLEAVQEGRSTPGAGVCVCVCMCACACVCVRVCV